MKLLLSKENGNIPYNNTSVYVDRRNSRLKITDSSVSQPILENIKEYAVKLQLGKILCNCRIYDTKTFKESGFIEEGRIPGFFNGEDAVCMSYFTDKRRKISPDRQNKDNLIMNCLNNPGRYLARTDDSITIADAREDDIPQMISLFKSIFASYPSPVFDSSYLKNCMATKTMFKIAKLNDEIVSIASAEMDMENNNAEITDCATNYEFRGKGLLTSLIAELENSLMQNRFNTLYSLSRSTEPGINKALHKMQYNYCGRLINNCDISGGFEDMNIWVKKLAQV